MMHSRIDLKHPPDKLTKFLEMRIRSTHDDSSSSSPVRSWYS